MCVYFCAHTFYFMSTPINLSLGEQILEVERELQSATLTVDLLKAKLKVLKHQQSMQLGIKWVDEIKKVLLRGDSSFRVVSIGVILFNIQVSYGIKPDRNIKNKIATTLSRLYNEGKICKSEYGGYTVYGYPEAFEADGLTIKEEYIDNVITR